MNIAQSTRRLMDVYKQNERVSVVLQKRLKFILGAVFMVSGLFCMQTPNEGGFIFPALYTLQTSLFVGIASVMFSQSVLVALLNVGCGFVVVPLLTFNWAFLLAQFLSAGQKQHCASFLVKWPEMLLSTVCLFSHMVALTYGYMKYSKQRGIPPDKRTRRTVPAPRGHLGLPRPPRVPHEKQEGQIIPTYRHRAVLCCAGRFRLPLSQ